ILAKDNVPKFAFRHQPALRGNGISEFLALGRGWSANKSGGINGVLRVDGGDNVIDGNVQLSELVRLDPKAHRILACPKYAHVGDAFQLRDLVNQIDVSVIGKKRCVVTALRGYQSDQQHGS